MIEKDRVWKQTSFKNVTARVLTRFSSIWFGDLMLDSKWPSFKLDLEIIKTNILSNSHNGYFKNVTTGWLTRFSFNLA